MNLTAALQLSNRQVLVQAIGRLLYQLSFGLISFYIPLLFVNQMGFSATSVGFALSLISITEVGGHFVGGTLADSFSFGRKMVLSLSGGFGMIVSLILVLANSLWALVLASLVLGVSLGFYWTASGAAVMDATDPADRPQAFAVLGVSEYIGLGFGILGGSTLLKVFAETPKWLFGGCALTFLGFIVIIQIAMASGNQPTSQHENSTQGILIALKDRLLIVFMLANIFFTTYFALMTSTVPLYFTNFVAGADPIPGVSIGSTANLFTWFYIGIGAVFQIPVTNVLNPIRRIYVLMGAMVLWATGFVLLWVTGAFAETQFLWGIIALCSLSIASVAYKPFFIATISDLAPETLRGVYIAVSSQCWTIGYFIGPLVGGWAMDQAPLIAHRFWLALATSTLLCIALLWVFETLKDRAISQASLEAAKPGLKSEF
jgi:MFS family permease